MADQPAHDPLHGQTLEMIVTQLVEQYGWEGLGERIKIQCFRTDPSVKSSLKFLRKTPWAREKVEALFVSTQNRLRRNRSRRELRRAKDLPEPGDVARRFARGLDEEDYDSVARWLAPDCEYEIAGETHCGPAAILESYRENADWATRNLDAVRYESAIRPGDSGGFVVEFVDHLEHAGKTLTHRCEQRLEFDGAGRISKIRHVDLPGEQEAVRAFLREADRER